MLETLTEKANFKRVTLPQIRAADAVVAVGRRAGWWNPRAGEQADLQQPPDTRHGRGRAHGAGSRAWKPMARPAVVVQTVVRSHVAAVEEKPVICHTAAVIQLQRSLDLGYIKNSVKVPWLYAEVTDRRGSTAAYWIVLIPEKDLLFRSCVSRWKVYVLEPCSVPQFYNSCLHIWKSFLLWKRQSH